MKRKLRCDWKQTCMSQYSVICNIIEKSWIVGFNERRTVQTKCMTHNRTFLQVIDFHISLYCADMFKCSSFMKRNEVKNIQGWDKKIYKKKNLPVSIIINSKWKQASFNFTTFFPWRITLWIHRDCFKLTGDLLKHTFYLVTEHHWNLPADAGPALSTHIYKKELAISKEEHKMP